MEALTASHDELVRLVHELQADNATLSATVARLEARIRDLEGGSGTTTRMPGHKPTGAAAPASSRPCRPRATNFARRRAVPTQQVVHAQGCVKVAGDGRTGCARHPESARIWSRERPARTQITTLTQPWVHAFDACPSEAFSCSMVRHRAWGLRMPGKRFVALHKSSGRTRMTRETLSSRRFSRVRLLSRPRR
jgi:hypothetical protein